MIVKKKVSKDFIEYRGRKFVLFDYNNKIEGVYWVSKSLF